MEARFIGFNFGINVVKRRLQEDGPFILQDAKAKVFVWKIIFLSQQVRKAK